MKTNIFSKPSGVAFRHIIEDGVSVLTSAPLDAARRNYVVVGLAKLFGDASRGYQQLSHGQALCMGIKAEDAFESFSFMERQIGRALDDTQIAAATQAFEKLSMNAQISQEEQKNALALLTELLASIERTGPRMVPFQPEEISLSV
jgi:hypothetical protein